MAIPTKQRIAGIKRGDTITAEPFLMNMVRQLNRDLDDFRPPRQVEEALPEGVEPADEEITKIRFTLVSEDTNTLLCFDPALKLVSVAKPPPLRGNINSRTVSGEAQVVIPTYTAGDFIFGEGGWDGGTGVEGVDFQDMNVAGRYWAEDA